VPFQTGRARENRGVPGWDRALAQPLVDDRLKGASFASRQTLQFPKQRVVNVERRASHASKCIAVASLCVSGSDESRTTEFGGRKSLVTFTTTLRFEMGGATVTFLARNARLACQEQNGLFLLSFFRFEVARDLRRV